MSFRDTIRADAERVLCNPDQLGEACTYIAFDGTRTAVTAVVVRENPIELGGADRAAREEYRVTIPATQIADVRSGADKIELPVRAGATELAEYRVAEIIRRGANVWTLGVVR